MCEQVQYQLTSAIRFGELECVRELVHSYGLSDLGGWSEGYNLLHLALRHRRTEIAKLLLTCGCKVDLAYKKTHNTPLYLSIRNCNIEIVEMLLQRGADVHIRNRRGSSMLHTAVQEGNREIVKLLLNHGADVRVADIYGVTPLHSASKRQSVQIVEDLLNHGADINSVCTEMFTLGYTRLNISSMQGINEVMKLFLSKGANTWANITPLHIAVNAGCKPVVKLLLEHGAKVDAQDNNGNTVLHFAVEIGNSKIVEDVLKYHPDINNQSNRSSFKTAVRGSRESYKEIVESLLQYGFIVHTKDVDNPELLRNSVEKGYLKIVEDLLKNGADVNMLHNSVSVSGGTLLHSAALNKQDEVAKLLIDYGANINAKNKRGETPIFYAVQNCDAIITRLLLTNGADIKDSSALLHSAATHRWLEIVEELLKRGADVNMLDHSKYGSGGTPLHSAVRRTREEVVGKLLVNHGTNVNSKDKTGETAIFYPDQNSDGGMHRLCLRGDTPPNIAVLRAREEVAKLLVNHGANVNAEDKWGKTPLFYAVKNNDARITGLLLTNGAEIKDSPTLMHTAADGGYLEIVEDLLKHGADVNMLVHLAHRSGGTPLHSAVRRTREEVAKLLINYGANVNAEDKWGKTPLFYAVSNNAASITRLLLTNGADIKDYSELLYTAIEKKCKVVVDVLLKHGADINIISKHYTPLEFAMSNRGYITRYCHVSIEIVELLKQHIAKLHVAGLYVSASNLKSMIDDCEIIPFQRECEGEIEIMKCEKISTSYVSFYNILTKNTHRLAIYAKNENIAQAITSADYKTKFPIYASMIEWKFREGLERKELMELGNQLLHSLFESVPNLPVICFEKIVSYLSNYDLRLLKHT